jgi:hypothetical protein
VKLDPLRSVSLTDLTWLKKETLSKIRWDDIQDVERTCKAIIGNDRSTDVEIGQERASLREWSGETMLDFKRDRRKSELDRRVVGGLPLGDLRQGNKKAYGEIDGKFIGFMDDLTPCRVKRSTPDRPWFRLNSQFMDAKKNRCFSGPPSHLGFCAVDLKSAKKLFFWYSLARTFLQHPYPMWVDSDDMWQPPMLVEFDETIIQQAFSIGYAENECVECTFPANNPLHGIPELVIDNPMTPLHSGSFWNTTMRPYCSARPSPDSKALINSVDRLFSDWKRLFRDRSYLPISKKAYLVDDRGLTLGAGILQIKDYANEVNDARLQTDLSEIHRLLKIARSKFFDLVTDTSGFDYFGSARRVMKKAVASEGHANNKIQIVSA